MPNLASQIRIGILEHRLEHGFKFAGRTADDLKHIGGGGLLLQATRAAR